MKTLLCRIRLIVTHVYALLATTLLVGFIATPAAALIIDFNDFPYSKDRISEYDQPIDDFYAYKGVNFFETYLQKESVGNNNFAFGLGGLHIVFSGTLPQKLLFNIFTESENGLDMYLFDTPETYTSQFFPSTQSFITLTNNAGISGIGFHNRTERTVMRIDNLSTYRKASVPEPMPLGLLVIGTAAIAVIRIRGKQSQSL